MPTLLTSGVNHQIATNEILTLPPNGCRMFVTLSTALSIDLSNDPAMANAKNFTATGGGPIDTAGANVSAGFMRVNGGAAIIRVVKA